MEKRDSPISATTEQQFKRRMAKYAAQNPEKQNTLSFFDDIDNHAQWIDVANSDEPAKASSFMTMLRKIGAPHNYGLTEDEKKANTQRDESQRLRKALDETSARKAQEEASRPQRLVQEAEWRQQVRPRNPSNTTVHDFCWPCPL